MKENGNFIRYLYNKYFLASFFSILMGSVGQIFNGIIIGNRLGKEALSVLSLTVPVYYLFATIGNLFGIGASATCAGYIGKNKEEECSKAFTASYIFVSLFCVFFSVVFLIFLPILVKGIGAGNPAITKMTSEYVTVMLIGGIFTAGNYMSFNFLRLDGRNREQVFIFALMNAINIGLDLLLTCVVPLGMTGVSLATTLGAAAATLFGIYTIWKKSTWLKFCRISRKDFFGYSKECMIAGSPGGVENICILIRSCILNNLIIGSFGVIALSTFSIVNSILSFSFSIISGAAGTLVSFIGIFSAEKDTVSIKRILRVTLIQGCLLTLIFSAICFVFAGTVGKLFGINENLGDVMVAVRWFVLSLVFSMMNHMIIYLNLANKHIILSNVATVLRNLALIVPVAFLMSRLFGIEGFWASFLVCEVLTLLVMLAIGLYISGKNPKLSRLTLLDETYEKEGKILSFAVSSDMSEISAGVEKAEEFCENNELDMKTTIHIKLALEEMLVSISEHSLVEKNNQISVRLLIYKKNTIIIRLRNAGKAFNPIAYYQLQVTKCMGNPEALLEMGDCIGIKMILELCNSVSYKTTFGVNNVTIII